MASNSINGSMLAPEPSWMETRSGKFIDLLKPEGHLITPTDIAYGMAHTCRFGGQVSHGWSVGEHTIAVHHLLMHILADDEQYSGMSAEEQKSLQLHALFHDGTEAYLGDLISPLKYALRVLEDEIYNKGIQPATAMGDGIFDKLYSRTEDAMCVTFGLEPHLLEHPAIKLADMWAVKLEGEALMASKGQHWRYDGEIPHDECGAIDAMLRPGGVTGMFFGGPQVGSPPGNSPEQVAQLWYQQVYELVTDHIRLMKFV